MKTLIVIMAVIFTLCAISSGAVILVSSLNDKERYAAKIGDMVKEIWHDLDEAIFTITMAVVILGSAMFIIGGTSIVADIGLGMCLFGPFIPVIMIPLYEFVDKHFVK